MALYVFARERVDVALLEVGIGGQYDSTNVVRHPVVCGVSSLDYDHVNLLGHTLPDIAWHKAGIFKVIQFNSTWFNKSFVISKEKFICGIRNNYQMKHKYMYRVHIIII